MWFLLYLSSVIGTPLLQNTIHSCQMGTIDFPPPKLNSLPVFFLIFVGSQRPCWRHWMPHPKQEQVINAKWRMISRFNRWWHLPRKLILIRDSTVEKIVVFVTSALVFRATRLEIFSSGLCLFCQNFTSGDCTQGKYVCRNYWEHLKTWSMQEWAKPLQNNCVNKFRSVNAVFRK